MTLFSLAKKNMAKNFSQYFIYIVSMIFSIVIYFTFVTMKYTDIIANEAEASKKISTIMSSSSFILLIFVIVFILYSNSFFMKKRKKEIGLYTLLGMRKRAIGFMLFVENLILGYFSLIVGIILGFFASKGLVLVLLKMMDYDAITTVNFSVAASVNTIIVFSIVFFITSLLGYRVVYKFKLIELFQADQQGEKVPQPKLWVSLLGLVLVVAGYVIALNMLDVMQVAGIATPLIILVFVIVGTYLLFHSLTGFYLTIVKKITKYSWVNLRLVTISQLLHRIRDNAQTLTIISILSATTLTFGGAVFGLYYNTKSNVQQYDPHTYMYVSDKENSKVNELIGKSDYELSAPIVYENFDARAVKDQFGSLGERNYAVISEQTYNEFAQKLQRKSISLGNAEGLMLETGYDERYSPAYDNKNIIAGKEKIKLIGVEKENVLNASIGATTVVVSNATFEKLAQKGDKKMMYAIGDKNATADKAEKVKALMQDENDFSSHTLDLRDSMQNVGILLFVGSFLGLVFLAATGSVIYFKILMEAESDKGQYMILHKLGVNNKAMNKSIAQQIFFIFFIPLVIGILHSIFALKTVSSLLLMNIFVPVLIWIALYTIIYAIYYFITFTAYKKIIKRTIRNEGN